MSAKMEGSYISSNNTATDAGNAEKGNSFDNNKAGGAAGPSLSKMVEAPAQLEAQLNKEQQIITDAQLAISRAEERIVVLESRLAAMRYRQMLGLTPQTTYVLFASGGGMGARARANRMLVRFGAPDGRTKRLEERPNPNPDAYNPTPAELTANGLSGALFVATVTNERMPHAVWKRCDDKVVSNYNTCKMFVPYGEDDQRKIETAYQAAVAIDSPMWTQNIGSDPNFMFRVQGYPARMYVIEHAGGVLSAHPMAIQTRLLPNGTPDVSRQRHLVRFLEKF